jgi:hypothetical protein
VVPASCAEVIEKTSFIQRLLFTIFSPSTLDRIHRRDYRGDAAPKGEKSGI